jgi:ESCRT-I complex subunit VPS28
MAEDVLALGTQQVEQDIEDEVDDTAELYAIIRACEKLERAYVQSQVGVDEYDRECQSVLAKFKTLCESLAIDGERFMRSWGLDDCRKARHRLLNSGMPATAEHRTSQKKGSVQAVQVAELFINALDALSLGERAASRVHPKLLELVTSLDNARHWLPPDFASSEHLTTLRIWLQQLSSMHATEELSERDSQELSHMVEAAYHVFKGYLNQ